MAIENITINASSLIINNASITVNRALTDAEVIGRMCTSYNNYLIIVYGIIFTALILKGIGKKMLHKDIGNMKKAKFYETMDDTTDMLVMFMVVLQILLFFFG